MPVRFVLRKPTRLNNILGGAFDVFFHIPFMYLPSFYVVRELIFALGDGTVEQPAQDISEVLRNSFQEYKSKLAEDAVASCKIFIPAHVVTFGFLPVHFRVPWILVRST